MAGGAAEQARCTATVRGRVQGVNFRAFTAQQAQRLGLTGSVRNLPDGRSVRVEAEGERPALVTLIARLHEGPPLARVDGVDVTWGEPQGGGAAFRVVH